MFSHILIASDGSEHALQAARVAAEIARRFEAKVTLLSVFDPPPTPMPPVPGMEPVIDPDVMLKYAEEVQEAVERRTGQVFEAAGVPYIMLREYGHPVDRIVSIAETEKADLIVMGSRGLGGIQSFLLGSVSDRVLHHAHCPVLIVR